MIKLLIVEDEYTVRYAMRHSIDWEEYGIEVAAEAENGREALEMVRVWQPHIVLTDIRMPVMGGLDFIARLKETTAGVRVIIISGYDDFSYAMRALKMGVNDYLLKPVDADLLIKTVTASADAIRKELEEILDKQYFDSVYSENLPQLQYSFLTRLANAPVIDYKSVLNRAKSLKISLDGPYFQAILIDIDDYYINMGDYTKYKHDIVKSSLMRIVGDVMFDWLNPIICYGEGRYLLMVLSGANIENDCVAKLGRQILDDTRKYMSLTLTVGIGSPREGLKGFSLSFKEAETAVRAKSVKGKDRLIFYSQVEERDNFRLPDNTAFQKEFITCIKTLDKRGVLEVVEKIFGRFYENLISLELSRVESAKLLLSAVLIIGEMGLDIPEHCEEYYNPLDALERLETIDEHKVYVTGELDRFIDIVEAQRSKKFKSIVTFAMQYVEENYSKGISLNDAAKALYVTPSYLSRIFKEETCENFVSYINEYRIKKAKSLLADPAFTVYQIAEKVGYHDYRYFNINFKKYTGYTAKEYRELIAGKRKPDQG
jgi:two-component system response regulator YesN